MQQIGDTSINRSWMENEIDKSQSQIKDNVSNYKFPLQDSTNLNLSLTLGKSSSSYSIPQKFVSL